MTRFSTVDCSTYLLGFCYEHPFVKFFALSIYVINTSLISMYVCTWIVCWGVCELLHVLCYDVQVEIIVFFVFVFILIDNELQNKYVFYFPMGVIKIFDWDGV